MTISKNHVAAFMLEIYPEVAELTPNHILQFLDKRFGRNPHIHYQLCSLARQQIGTWELQGKPKNTEFLAKEFLNTMENPRL